MDNKNNNINQQYGLHLSISVSDSTSLFNPEPKKLLCKYSLLELKDTHLILKSNHKTLANINQFALKKEENLIFKIKINSSSIIIKNKLDICILIDLNKYYHKLLSLNNRLYKSLLKFNDDIKITDKNRANYFFDLNENDIIRVGNVKLILREFHISGNNLKNNSSYKIKNIFTLKLKNEINKICSICKQGYTDDDKNNNNPIIGICNCNENKKYVHFNCKKKEISIKGNDINNTGSICFYYNTHCDCGKFFPLNFYLEENDEKNQKMYKLYELMDIPRNKDEDYLLFETLEFQNNDNYYVKYFFYIKLETKDNKEKINIMIGKEKNYENKNEHKYEKIIKIDDEKSLSNYHALIEYDKKTKKLRLKNISNTQNTLVLKNFEYEFELKPDNHDNLIFEMRNIKIDAKLIKKEKFEEIKNEEKNNPYEIEERNCIL